MTEDKIKHPTSTNDSQLFRSSVGNVKRIQSDKLPPNQISSRTRKELITTYQSSTPYSIKTDYNLEGSESVFFSHDGVNGQTAKSMKQGNIKIDDYIDLHGLTKKNAKNVIIEFIASSLLQAHRYILIIHGKGYGGDKKFPILKNLTINLLSNHPDIVAFTSATQRDGGTGAVYVLLKK